jgi:hypothetical protein
VSSDPLSPSEPTAQDLEGLVDRLGAEFMLDNDPSPVDDDRRSALATKEAELAALRAEFGGEGRPSEVAETVTGVTEAEVEAKPDEDAEKEEAKPVEAVEDGDEIKTTEDLAKVFEVEQEELLGKLSVPLGDEMVPLKDVIERATQAPAPAQMAAMMVEQRAMLDQNEAARQHNFMADHTAYVGVTNAILTQTEAERGFDQASLAALKRDDPELWAVRVAERREFYGTVQANVMAAQQFQARQNARTEEVLQQRRVEEGMKIIQAVPEWADSEVAVKEATEIHDAVCGAFGFTQEEMHQMPDHRLALLMRRWHQLEGYVYQEATKKQETRKTLDAKKLRAQRTTVPNRSARLDVNSRSRDLAALSKAQRETAGDPSKLADHYAASAQLMGAMMDLSEE